MSPFISHSFSFTSYSLPPFFHESEINKKLFPMFLASNVYFNRRWKLFSLSNDEIVLLQRDLYYVYHKILNGYHKNQWEWRNFFASWCFLKVKTTEFVSGKVYEYFVKGSRTAGGYESRFINEFFRFSVRPPVLVLHVYHNVVRCLSPISRWCLNTVSWNDISRFSRF